MVEKEMYTGGGAWRLRGYFEDLDVDGRILNRS
jgi:hypothetical protein